MPWRNTGYFGPDLLEANLTIAESDSLCFGLSD